MPLNLEPLDNNPWLAGFLDGDGHFSVRATAPNEKRKHHIVECRLELVQRQIYHVTPPPPPVPHLLIKKRWGTGKGGGGGGISNYSFMLDIATFLGTRLEEVRVDSPSV